jgi:hypothetical protein
MAVWIRQGLFLAMVSIRSITPASVRVGLNKILPLVVVANPEECHGGKFNEKKQRFHLD